ncbi:MAG: SDR family NAD(P)-dependent oxidoreductase, partial [Candidatus Binataceae bacterium]
MDLELKGKVAMVTGGSRGLGRAMAEALAAEGMSVSICARDARAVSEVSAEVSEVGKRAGAKPTAGFAGDVTSASQMEKWIAAVVRECGRIDVLVNNAGAARPGALAELPESAWQEQ